MRYSTEKNTGGKGFHYFLRDIASVIISHIDQISKLEFSKENIEIASEYINHLIKLSGDNKNIIFKTNLRLITELIEKLKNYIYLNKKTILDMLKIDENKTAAHIWKIAAIQVLASAVDNDVSITDSEIYTSHGRRFISSLEKNEEIIGVLLKLCDSNRTPVQSAAVELLSKIMSTYTENDKFYNVIYDYLENQCVNKSDKFSINAIFRVSLHFQLFINRKKIFNKSLLLFKNSNQNNRNLLLNTFYNYIDKIFLQYDENKNLSISDKSSIDDIYYNLYPLVDAILIDPNDELIINLSKLMLQFLKVKENKYNECISKFIIRISKDIIKMRNTTRMIFYEFLIKIYETSSVLSKSMIFNMIISNFEKETDSELKEIIIIFLNKNNNIPLDPVERMIFLLNNLTDENVEEKLIQNITKLLLILSLCSSDYNI